MLEGGRIKAGQVVPQRSRVDARRRGVLDDAGKVPGRK